MESRPVEQALDALDGGQAGNQARRIARGLPRNSREAVAAEQRHVDCRGRHHQPLVRADV